MRFRRLFSFLSSHCEVEWRRKLINFLITDFMLRQLSKFHFLFFFPILGVSRVFIARDCGMRKIVFDWHEKCSPSKLFAQIKHNTFWLNFNRLTKPAILIPSHMKSNQSSFWNFVFLPFTCTKRLLSWWFQWRNWVVFVYVTVNSIPEWPITLAAAAGCWYATSQLNKYKRSSPFSITRWNVNCSFSWRF